MPTLHRTRRPLLAAALLLGVAGCSLFRKDDPPGLFGEAGGRSTIQIEVVNLNFLDATLHAFNGSERHRLGIVTGKGQATYTMPWRTSLPLQIEIDLLAGESCVTRSLVTNPGDVVHLQIQTELLRDPDCLRRRGNR